MTAVLRVDIVGNARDAQAAIASTDGSLDKLGKTGSKLGPLLKAGAVAGVGAIALLGKAAFDSASALQQATGAVESVFGKQAENVKKFAKGAADSVGLAQSQYSDLAALLGSQLTNMGRNTKEAAGETDKLIRLGSDLAATYGGSVSDAVSAVSSLLKGERDPIERYGASIKQATIDAELQKQGLDKLTGSAKTQAEATAALTILTEQTSAAHGAFAREADTAAGAQARLGAKVENAKAQLGEALLPVMTKVFNYLAEVALPAAQRLGAELAERFGPTVRQVGVFIRDDVVPALRQLWEWFEEKILPQLRKAIIPIVEAVVDRFRLLSAKVDENSENLEKLGRFIGKLIEWAAKLLPVIGKTLAAAFDVTSVAIGLVIDVIATLVGWIDKAIEGAKKLGDALAPLKAVGGFIGGLNPFASPVAGQLAPLAGRAADTGGRLGPMITAAAGQLGGGGFLGSVAGAGAVQYVDARRTVNVTISDALDPAAVAERVRRLLREDDLRAGRASSFLPATGWAG